MGNLGPYEEITALAKSLGGVDKLIENISEAAVAKAAPKMVAAGAIVGGVLVVAAIRGGKAVLAKYREVRTVGQDAEEQLRAEVDKVSDSGEPVIGATDDPLQTDEPTQP